jgi:signal transduction histidine kinase
MVPIIEQISQLLSSPMGNLMYSMVLGLCAFGAFVASWYASGRQASADGKRMQKGLLFLFLGQLILFTTAWLAWLGVINEHTFLPPLNRTVALFSLVLIIWLWAFPKPNSKVDNLTIVFEILVLLAGAISFIWWIQQDINVFFNTSIMGAYAFYIGLALLIAGLILVIWLRPTAWGYGIVMLFIILVGYLAQFFFRQPAGDFAWFVQTGEMLAYPLLFALPIRLLQSSEAPEIVDVQNIAPIVGLRIDETFLRSVIELNNEQSLQDYYQKLTRMFGRLMDAAVCLLAMPPNIGEQIIFPVGYRLCDDRMVDGFTADGRKMPLLLDALRSRKNLRIDGASPTSEVAILASELEISQSTHLMVVPFNLKNSNTKMGILLLSQSLQPSWSDIDEQQMMMAVKLLDSDLGQSVKESTNTAEVQEIMDELQRTQAEAVRIHQDYALLKAEYDRLSSQGLMDVAQVAGAAVILDSQKSLEDTVRRLETRNRELEILVSKGRPSIEEIEQLRLELRNALEDLARIPTTLSKSDQKMLEMQLATMKHLDDIGQSGLVTSIAQEFNQPLSSIIGYTDLLLGESVGLLGAMQRKFLERVKASTERLGILMDELVEVLAIDDGKLDQTLTNVDFETVIDDAVGSIINQISEKNITMRVDLPEKLPEIQANRDALLQILANLLQNACLVTPPDGEIRLFSRVETKNEANYLLVAVSDQGGGISKVDIPRVFSRRYKVENPLIQGIGDSGVGLSIVNSLVELLRGRVWVDTQEGIGSTFSALLPLTEDHSIPVNPESLTQGKQANYQPG